MILYSTHKTLKSQNLELGYLEFNEIRSVFLNQKFDLDCFLQP